MALDVSRYLSVVLEMIHKWLRRESSCFEHSVATLHAFAKQVNAKEVGAALRPSAGFCLLVSKNCPDPASYTCGTT